MPNNNEMGNVKMYAVVDGEYREVMELQGEITLHECDEQLWQYDYVRVVRCWRNLHGICGLRHQTECDRLLLIRRKEEQMTTNQSQYEEMIIPIRCKDCKWRDEPGCAIRIVDESDRPKDDDFCSFGERKDDEID